MILTPNPWYESGLGTERLRVCQAFPRTSKVYNRGNSLVLLNQMPEEPFEEPIPIPITDVFDLHSVSARDVGPVVEEYLLESYRLGLKALRIIHGRGIGVQREIVRKILERTPFVATFGDAPAEAGGWGATIVTLR
jgi:dsDNA-specific endonuclease/ATPase MutS2